MLLSRSIRAGNGRPSTESASGTQQRLKSTPRSAETSSASRGPDSLACSIVSAVSAASYTGSEARGSRAGPSRSTRVGAPTVSARALPRDTPSTSFGTAPPRSAYRYRSSPVVTQYTPFQRKKETISTSCWAWCVMFLPSVGRAKSAVRGSLARSSKNRARLTENVSEPIAHAGTPGVPSTAWHALRMASPCKPEEG
jgi:hypothetical protein